MEPRIRTDAAVVRDDEADTATDERSQIKRIKSLYCPWRTVDWAITPAEVTSSSENERRTTDSQRLHFRSPQPPLLSDFSLGARCVQGCHQESEAGVANEKVRI